MAFGRAVALRLNKTAAGGAAAGGACLLAWFNYMSARGKYMSAREEYMSARLNCLSAGRKSLSAVGDYMMWSCD
jgi:hypothetical protein